MLKPKNKKKYYYKRQSERQRILKQANSLFPEELQEVLNQKQRGLVKYLLAQVDVTELQRMYGVTRTEIVLDVLELGYTLAVYNITEEKIEPKIPMNAMSALTPEYLKGFHDCKKSIREVSQNEFRKRRQTK